MDSHSQDGASNQSFLLSGENREQEVGGGEDRQELARLRRIGAFWRVIGKGALGLSLFVLALWLLAPPMYGYDDEARLKATKSQISIFESALDTFEIDNHRFPTAQEGLAALCNAPNGLAQSWKGPYLSKGIPQTPWRNDYFYQFPGKLNPSGYDIVASGKDGRIGTEDDVNNVEDLKD